MTSSSNAESHFTPSHQHNSIRSSSVGTSPNGLPKKRIREDDTRVELPFRVAQWYYKHGLFLSSYPSCATSIAVAVILFCCYPLLNIPLPGTIPTKVIFPYNESVNQNLRFEQSNNSAFNFNANNIFSFYNISLEAPYPWARIDPLLYVQQIILRTSVVPWEENLQLTDAYRGPLYEIFKLLEIIRNHEDEQKVTLSHLCLHVENVKRPAQQSLFPEYNCLILSPANLWQQNIQNFNKDNNLLHTVFLHHNLHKAKVSTADMLFGIDLRDTGIKRYPMRVRSRIIQYAVTLILRENNEDFLNSLKEKLTKTYPLHQDENSKASPQQSSIMYIFYPGEFNLMEIVPQCGAFLMLFLYVYFSVRKIDVIRSRLVLASSAVITVLGSLIMSLGLCFFFGLTISMQSKGIYPYLVILVGLENVLVITKSVVTTDNNLDVKIRVAQGLSKEGWSITKNLLTEITILTVGLATLVPVIQEFCIFAIVGLISDFFLQMLFFSTILAFDIKRIEYSAEVKQLPKMLYYNNDNFRNNVLKYPSIGGGGMNRSRSHPKLAGLEHQAVQTNHLKKNSLTSSAQSSNKKIPKRLRIVNFWARTRFFQRGFMIWMVLWISNIIYNSGLIEELFVIDKNSSSNAMNERKLEFALNNDLKKDANDERAAPKVNVDFDYPINVNSMPKQSVEKQLNLTEQLNKLKHSNYETVYQLSNFHWSSILKQYNISLSGRYVTVLPAIKLSNPVSPQVAVNLRNPDEHVKWNALALALGPLDLHDVDMLESPHMNVGNTPFYPKTPMEILLTTILIAVSVFVVTYTMVVLYRCICSRNYAEWRASWNDSESDEPKQEQRVLEGVPIQVNGHTHRIECLVTDGNMIASSCLQGQVKIWDITNGDFVAEIDRLKYFDVQQTEVKPNSSVYINNVNKDSVEEVFPASDLNHKSPTNLISKLKTKIQFNFTCQQQQAQADPKLYDFKTQYQKYFSNHIPDASNDDSDCRNRFLNKNSPMTTFIQRSQSNDDEQSYQQQNHHQQQYVKKLYCSSPIWCLDFMDNLIVIGCADGRLEFWEGTTGNFKCIYETESTHNNGVTNIKLAGDKVIAARLSGRIDFLKLETYTQGRQIDWGFTSAYRRTHIRTGSAGSLGFLQSSSPTSTATVEELRCILEFQQQGHQQPITCLEVVGSTVMTGSQDHTVKVFRLENHLLLYTLHGHCGPITSLFIDQWQSGTGGSGSQDGLLCVWDLITGACMYKIQAHEDSIVSLTCSPSYVISLGLDERLRIWERFQGHPLNTINVMHAYTMLLMLTPSLLVTGKPGSLIVWDVRTGEAAREVKLDCSNSQLCPKIMLPACGSVICDYGNQMRIVRFPLVAADKCE